MDTMLRESWLQIERGQEGQLQEGTENEAGQEGWRKHPDLGSTQESDERIFGILEAVFRVMIRREQAS